MPNQNAPLLQLPHALIGRDCLQDIAIDDIQARANFYKPIQYDKRASALSDYLSHQLLQMC